MDLREWLAQADPAERERIASVVGTTVPYLWQLAGNHRRPSLELAQRFHVATEGAVSVYDLRPDLRALERLPRQESA